MKNKALILGKGPSSFRIIKKGSKLMSECGKYDVTDRVILTVTQAHVLSPVVDYAIFNDFEYNIGGIESIKDSLGSIKNVYCPVYIHKKRGREKIHYSQEPMSSLIRKNKNINFKFFNMPDHLPQGGKIENQFQVLRPIWSSLHTVSLLATDVLGLDDILYAGFGGVGYHPLFGKPNSKQHFYDKMLRQVKRLISGKKCTFKLL